MVCTRLGTDAILCTQETKLREACGEDLPVTHLPPGTLRLAYSEMQCDHRGPVRELHGRCIGWSPAIRQAHVCPPPLSPASDSWSPG